MDEETAKIHALAQRLLAREGADSADSTRLVDAAEEVCRKLRERLALVIGQGGFSAILDHAVKLTRTQFPFLPADLAGHESPCVKGLLEGVRDHDPSQLHDAVTTLWTNFLVSLVSHWPGPVLHVPAGGLARDRDGLVSLLTAVPIKANKIYEHDYVCCRIS